MVTIPQKFLATGAEQSLLIFVSQPVIIFYRKVVAFCLDIHTLMEVWLEKVMQKCLGLLYKHKQAYTYVYVQNKEFNMFNKIVLNIVNQNIDDIDTNFNNTVRQNSILQ